VVYVYSYGIENFLLIYHTLALLTQVKITRMKTAARRAVILFTRFPVPGNVKTRLIGNLGAQGASDVHKQMTELILLQIQPAVQQLSAQMYIFFFGGSKEQMSQWLGSNMSFFPQKGDDLGQRMLHAFKQTSKRGAKQILLIGSDCPSIDEAIIEAGFAALQNHDLVLGPAVDGGYYLIGLQALEITAVHKRLFSDISWGESTVLQQTVQRLEAGGLSCQFLPQLHDIDRPEDLVYLNHHTRS